MSRFQELLKHTAARLDLPQPARSRILLEIASDLEDMYAAYREKGFSDEQAARKVEETFRASDDTLTELSRLHRSAIHGGMDSLSEQASTLWEKLMLIAVALFIALSTGSLLLQPSFFAEASGFIWPGAILGGLAVVLFLVKAFHLFVRQGHAPRRLRRGLPFLLLIACAALFNGLFGLLSGMQTAMFRIAGDYETAGTHLSKWLVGSTATMILSLLVAILGALLWFVLISKVKRIEVQQAARLLEDPR